MTASENKSRFSEDDAVGWLAIDSELEKLYPGQEPKHYGTIVKYPLGGEDPLDGFSIYESKKVHSHFHIITYGFSNLYYDENSAGEEFSNWGFELTFRTKQPGNETSDDQVWAMNVLQNIARYGFLEKIN